MCSMVEETLMCPDLRILPSTSMLRSSSPSCSSNTKLWSHQDCYIGLLTRPARSHSSRESKMLSTVEATRTRSTRSKIIEPSVQIYSQWMMIRESSLHPCLIFRNLWARIMTSSLTMITGREAPLGLLWVSRFLLHASMWETSILRLEISGVKLRT